MRKYRVLPCILTVSLILLACGNPLQGTPDSSSTLAGKIVDEWAASMASSSSRAVGSVSGGASRAIIDSSRIASLKASALASIKAAGKADSTKMDEIIPAMIEGISTGISASGYTSMDKVSLMDATAAVLVTSIGKSGREANLSSGTTTSALVGTVTAKVVNVILVQVAPTDPTLSVTAIGNIVDSAVSSIGMASTISSTDAKKAAIVAITNSVSITVLTDTSFSSTAAAAISSIGQSATSAIDDILTPADVASTAAQIVQAEVSAAASSSTLSSEVLAAVVAGVSSGSGTTTLTSTAIQSAITAGVGTGTAAPTVDVTAILAEVAPTVTVRADKTTVTAATDTITLTATAEPSTVTYSWSQVSGPFPVSIASTTSSASVSLSYPGSYTFRANVANAGGHKSAYADISLTANFAASKINEGIKALSAKDFDGARTAFLAARAQSSTDPEAIMWSSLLDLAATSTNSTVVSLMKDNIGLSSYPATMNELFSTSWFNSAWYEKHDGFYASESGSYVRGTCTQVANGKTLNVYEYEATSKGCTPTYISSGEFTLSSDGVYYMDKANYEKAYTTTIPTGTSLYAQGLIRATTAINLPAVAAPDWLKTMIPNSATGTKLDDLSMYPTVVMASIISKNPTGFNALADKALSGAYGSSFESIYSRIMALNDSDFITVPASVFSAFADVSATPLSAGITIEGRELKLYAAQMRLQKAFVEYVASYSLQYPVNALAEILASVNGTTTTLTSVDLSKIDNPIEAGLLAQRSSDMRDSSKSDFIAALTVIKDTTSGFDKTVCAKYATLSGSDAATIQGYFSQAEQLSIDLLSSIAAGIRFKPSTDSASTISLNLKVLFDSAFFSPSNLVETHGAAGAAGSGFTLYGTTTLTTNGLPDASAIASYDSSLTTQTYVGLKIKAASIDALMGTGTASGLTKLNGKGFVATSDGSIYVFFSRGDSGSLWAMLSK